MKSIEFSWFLLNIVHKIGFQEYSKSTGAAPGAAAMLLVSCKLLVLSRQHAIFAVKIQNIAEF